MPRRRWPGSTPPPSLTRLDTVVHGIKACERSVGSRIGKRAVDIAGSSIALLFLSPLFAIVAVLVRFTSPGPAFFVQERCGLRGKRFRFYKFRTMFENADAQKADLAHLNEMRGPIFKIARDPRVTRLGRWLRRSSIDELPQLWNVLKGDMSLVGPRPPLPEEVELYDARQAQRLSVPPGITGLWQVSGRSDIADFDRWLDLDLEYVRRCSMWFDFRIMLRTIVAVISARGAQ